MTRNIVRYSLLALLVFAGAATALAEGAGEGAMADAGGAAVIADNHGDPARHA
jgi:hypothetical protein